jgi:hypothetical protein
MKLLYAVIDGHKECSDCHIIKEVSLFKNRCKPNKDGSFSPETMCRDCSKIRVTKYNRLRGIKPSKRYPIIDNHKRCTTCNENKHISDYDFKWNGKMFAKCKPCLKLYVHEMSTKHGRKQYSKDWHSKNKEKEIIRRKEYNVFQTENLTDYYIKSLIIRPGDLEYIDVTQEMVDMKRKQVLLLRQIKQSKSL